MEYELVGGFVGSMVLWSLYEFMKYGEDKKTKQQEDKGHQTNGKLEQTIQKCREDISNNQYFDS